MVLYTYDKRLGNLTGAVLTFTGEVGQGLHETIRLRTLYIQGYTISSMAEITAMSILYHLRLL